MSHYHHLSIEERESLLRIWSEGKGIRAIAKEMGRSASTISREIHRNCRKRSEYSPSAATKRYKKRRKKCCKVRKFKEPQAKALVRRLILEQQWSPEQISHRLKFENNPFQVSYTTIYRSIYLGDLDENLPSHGSRGIVRKLRHKGKSRHSKGYVERRGKYPVSHPIEERPEEANNRSQLGHWEGDTVLGKSGSSCMVTMADRKSRFLLGQRISRRAAALTNDAMVAMLIKLPPEKRRSITPDRGCEFIEHAKVSEVLDGIPFYFPKPRHPWERGTSENTNGLIREYCPRNTDMDQWSDDYFAEFIDKLNHRPRKCLGWLSPFEVFFDCLLHLT